MGAVFKDLDYSMNPVPGRKTQAKQNKTHINKNIWEMLLHIIPPVLSCCLVEPCGCYRHKQENNVIRGIRYLFRRLWDAAIPWHSRCIYSIKRSNNLSISLFASVSFVEHSHYSLWYFFDLRGFHYTLVVIRMWSVCVWGKCTITITNFSL